MAKLLFDSDALIKLAKARILSAVTTRFDVYITEDVRRETVEQGYADAQRIEAQLDDMTVIPEHEYRGRDAPGGFGPGETSVYQARTDHVIVSDDRAFTDQIEHTMTSANIIPVLTKKDAITKQTAKMALDKMRPYIRQAVYERVKDAL